MFNTWWFNINHQEVSMDYSGCYETSNTKFDDEASLFPVLSAYPPPPTPGYYSRFADFEILNTPKRADLRINRKPYTNYITSFNAISLL